MSIPFGKYKNKTIDWVYLNDKKYFQWLETIPLKEPFATEFAQFHLDLVKKDEENQKIHMNKVITLIHKYIKDKEPIYGVNVHSVGFEFRFNGISLENVLDKHYTLWYNNDNKKRIEVKLSKDNWKLLYNILKEYWNKSGNLWQDRGLY